MVVAARCEIRPKEWKIRAITTIGIGLVAWYGRRNTAKRTACSEPHHVDVLHWIIVHVEEQVNCIGVEGRISANPAANCREVATYSVRLRAVLGVPLGTGEAAGVGDVFGGGAVLAAEGLVGVGVLNGFIGCKCQVPG